jgi:manganese efflux pump family protein
MIELIFLAIALSMDGFAISIGLGTKQGKKNYRLALITALYFAAFHVLMPLLGYLGGKGLLQLVEAYAPIIAFALLSLIGAKMIVESFAYGIEKDIKQISHRLLLTLALATSVDAMAAGFTLPLLDVQPLIACTIIGLITFVFSYVGVLIGAKSGAWLESKAELLGGVVLILIGVRVLVAM